MPTITLTQSACSAGLTADWTAIDAEGKVNFENAVSSTLGGAGIEITRITISGRVRNSATAVKRLRLGFKPAISSGRDTWSASGGSSVLDSAFTAIDAANVAGTYIYRTFTRVYDGSNNATAFALFSTHIRSSFAASTPVYLGIIQPDASREISIYVEGYWKITVTYELIGNIPTANVSTAEIGATEITTTINKVVDGSSTTLRFKIGSTTLHTESGITGTTFAYTPPSTVGQYFPTTLTGTLTIEAETFVGETSYGIVTTSVTLTLPSDKAPTCTTTLSVAWVDGVDAGAQFDVYVQGKGGVRVQTAGTAMYGATIASYSVTCEGKAYSGADVTHKPFTGSGSVKVYTTVADSRGVVSTTQEDTLTVIAWKQPQITAFSVGRVDASGDPLRDGVRMKATITATANSITVAAAEENSIEFQVEYREKGAATWTQAKAVSVAGISIDGGYVLQDALGADIVTFDDTKGYDFALALADIYDTSTASAQIATSEIIADFNTVDNGVAIGGESTGEKFESYKPAYFYDGVPQYDYSSSEVDTGIKWLDGKTLYSKVLTITTASSNVDITSIVNASETLLIGEYFGSYTLNSNKYSVTSMYNSSTDLFRIYINHTNKFIRVNTGTGTSNILVYVRLLYTKP